MSGFNFNSTNDRIVKNEKDTIYVETSLDSGVQYDDYNLRETSSSLSVRTGDAAKITGFRPKYEGQVLTITNRIGAGRTLIIMHLNSSSSSSYRIDLTANGGGSDLTIDHGNTAVFKYDDTQEKWWLVSYSRV